MTNKSATESTEYTEKNNNVKKQILATGTHGNIKALRKV
jgi:hypothetical protein